MINIYKCMPHAFECIMYFVLHVYTFWAKKKVIMPDGVICAHTVCVCVCVCIPCMLLLLAVVCSFYICVSQVDKQEKRKKKTGRAKRRIQYNRRFVNVVQGFGRRRGPNANS